LTDFVRIHVLYRLILTITLGDGTWRWNLAMGLVVVASYLTPFAALLYLVVLDAWLAACTASEFLSA
jgi:hypothetical protein